MQKYPFLHIDAFTTRPFEGNPCAVILDADDLDEATMQAVAVEMNLSETAFVMKSQIADFGARYFTPAAEIPLAGLPPSPSPGRCLKRVACRWTAPDPLLPWS